MKTAVSKSALQVLVQSRRKPPQSETLFIILEEIAETLDRMRTDKCLLEAPHLGQLT